MATQEISPTAFQTACAECADAINAQDWALAKRKYALAEAIASAFDVEGRDGAAWSRRRESLAGLNAAIDAAQSATTRASGTGRFVTTQTGFGS